MITQRAIGTFEVTIQPLSAPDALPGRMALDKEFHGDLSGVGKGEMLTALTDTEGSAGYVAIERVTGALHGRQGSFVFQHTGIMNQGAQQLSIVVVPDSGTEQLTGIAGVFSLTVADGKHHYIFDYTLPEEQV